jgi:hypothetical protein
MAFRLRTGRSIGHELKRLYESQLDAGMSGLRGAGGADAHRVRKHVKKARALLHCARSLQHDWADADEELRTANRLLGVLSDAHRVIEAADRLREFDRDLLPGEMSTRLHAALVERAARFDAVADRDGTMHRAGRLLASARARTQDWQADGIDAAAMVRMVRDAHDAAREARAEVRRRPTVEAYHRWRHRVRREWHLFRIIFDQTGGRLRDEQSRLAALDASLGELHDVNVLGSVLTGESILPRGDTVGIVRVARARARDLRRRIALLAVVLNDRPRDMASRVAALWGRLPQSSEARWTASA